MADVIIYSIAFGITGFLVSAILTQPGEVLAWWPEVVQWVARTKKKSPMEYNAVQWWFSKITYLCGKCIAGNLSIWYAFFELEPGSGFVTVSLSIFSAWAIEKYYNG